MTWLTAQRALDTQLRPDIGKKLTPRIPPRISPWTARQMTRALLPFIVANEPGGFKFWYPAAIITGQDSEG